MNAILNYRIKRYSKLSVVISIALLVSSLSIWAQNDAKVMKSVMEKNNEFMTEFKKGDASRLTEFYSEDVQLLPSGLPAIKGKEHVLNYWKMGMQSGIQDFILETVEAYSCGNKVIEQGKYTIFAGENIIADKGKYIVIWKKEGGKLKISKDIFNSDNPPPAPLPRAAENDTMLIIYNYIKADMIDKYIDFNTNILYPIVKIDDSTPQGNVRTLQGLNKNDDGTYTCIYLVDPSSSNANYGMLSALVKHYGEEKGREYYEIHNSCLEGFRSKRFIVTSVW